MGEVEAVRSFAERARNWIDENLPPLIERENRVDNESSHLQDVAEARELQRAIFDGGFAGICYPQEYGGQGLTRDHQIVWRQLTTGRQVPNLFKITHGILGPTILDFGSEEQKTRHIPAMLCGDELWVQFLSEPSAGSDLASILTRATRIDDSFMVEGSKIWSTGADVSDYALVLVRTDVESPKHKGLSIVIMPIHYPGVTVRPIQLATGRADFCEEFFDEVILPATSIVGQENDGWNVLMRLFFHERNMVAGNGLNDFGLAGFREGVLSAEQMMINLTKMVGKSKDPYTRQILGEAIVLDRLADYTIARVNAQMNAGTLPPPSASILKLMKSLSQYRFREIALAIGGARVAMNGVDDEIGIHGHRWLVARVDTIAGGTNEMQRNAISERVLGLPREPATDTNVPFREVLARRQ